MRTKLERKIDHIISMIDRQSNKNINNNYKVIEKIVSEISNFSDIEKSAFFMKLFSEKHDDEIVFLIIESCGFLLIKYNAEICEQYNDKCMFHLAIENNYSAKTILKFYEMNRSYYMSKTDKNGFTIFHTLMSSNNPEKYLIYKKLINTNELGYLEEKKDNNNNTYIDLVKNQINENKNRLTESNTTERDIVETWSNMVKNAHLKNILCDYYYRHFDEFLDMLTDDVEQNKKLILDNLIFTDYTIAEENDYEKYDASKLLFRCIANNKEFDKGYCIYKKDENELLSIIKKLLETKYPKITKNDNFISFAIDEGCSIDFDNFISFAIDEGYSIDFVLRIFEMLDELGEEIPDWFFYKVLITYIKNLTNILSEGKFIDLYDYFCERGFNLLNVNINKHFLDKCENILKLEISFFGSNKYFSFLKKMVIDMHNALSIQYINKSLANFNCKELIINCRDFSGKRLLAYDIDEVGAEKIALKIIENRKDAIYVSDEITKEEVIIAIEECKPILDEMYKTQGSSDYNKINTNFARADGEIIKNFENELIYVKKR